MYIRLMNIQMKRSSVGDLDHSFFRLSFARRCASRAESTGDRILGTGRNGGGGTLSCKLSTSPSPGAVVDESITGVVANPPLGTSNSPVTWVITHQLKD